MSKIDHYREIIITLDDWDEYLLAESGLPGPRANLERARAVADEGSPELFWRYASLDEKQAPTNSPHEFLAFCGVVGLGTLLAKGDRVPFKALLGEMQEWVKGNLLEKRELFRPWINPRLILTENVFLLNGQLEI